MRLENQIAIVTGAGRNIGEAVGHSFVAEGAKVALVDLRLDAAQAVADAINAANPGCAVAIGADVSSSDDVQRMVASTVAAFGGVDILVNNAAITDHTPALDSGRGRVGPRHRRNAEKRVPDGEIRGPTDAGSGARREDHQHRVNVRASWACGCDSLLCGERRRTESDPLARDPVGAVRRAG